MELQRRHYLGRLQQFLDVPAITAVTGIRRAGKSVLLRQFAAPMRDERQVVYVDRSRSRSTSCAPRATSWTSWSPPRAAASLRKNAPSAGT